jgi:pyruvate formate lyase activating enzyme
MTDSPTLRLHSYESFGAVDGPGIRLVVFLQGCPLRCLFCHNPDTWDPKGGREVTIEEIVQRAKRMRPYLGNEGGVTFSGGEPLLQAPALLHAIQALHQEGFHVAVDTSGAIDTPETRAVLDAADLILLDVKSPTPARFKEVTGLDMAPTCRIFDYLRTTQKPIWIRQVVAHGLNETADEKAATKTFIEGLNVQRIDRLPYHELGLHKYESLGIPYRGSHLSKPSDEELSL